MLLRAPSRRRMILVAGPVPEVAVLRFLDGSSASRAGRRVWPYLFGVFLFVWVVMEVWGHAGLLGF